MTEPYQPIIDGKLLTGFTIVFAILAFASLIWYITYLNGAEEKSKRGIILGGVLTSLFIGTFVQLIFFSNNIVFF